MNGLRLALFAAPALLAFVAPAALADATRTVDASMLYIADVAPGTEHAELELGPAPPPGSSRLVERREVEQTLRASGFDAKNLKMAASVRVMRAGKRLETKALEEMTEPLLRAALPPGVTLRSFRVSRALLVGPRATVKPPELPKLPHHAGDTRTTVMFEFIDDGSVAARVAAAVTLNLDDAAAQPAVLRGARVDLVIEKGPARVSAVGYAMSDGDRGDVIPFRVDTTDKILQARVESAQLAKVVRP